VQRYKSGCVDDFHLVDSDCSRYRVDVGLCQRGHVQITSEVVIADDAVEKAANNRVVLDDIGSGALQAEHRCLPAAEVSLEALALLPERRDERYASGLVLSEGHTGKLLMYDLPHGVVVANFTSEKRPG
jgi:hypothetical protein